MELFGVAEFFSWRKTLLLNPCCQGPVPETHSHVDCVCLSPRPLVSAGPSVMLAGGWLSLPSGLALHKAREVRGAQNLRRYSVSGLTLQDVPHGPHSIQPPSLSSLRHSEDLLPSLITDKIPSLSSELTQVLASPPCAVIPIWAHPSLVPFPSEEDTPLLLFLARGNLPAAPGCPCSSWDLNRSSHSAVVFPQTFTPSFSHSLFSFPHEMPGKNLPSGFLLLR